MQVAFRKSILRSRFLVLRLASVEKGHRETYETVKKLVQARGGTTLWEVPDHEVVCCLEIRSILPLHSIDE